MHLVESALIPLVMKCIPEHHCLTSQPAVANNCTAATSCLLLPGSVWALIGLACLTHALVPAACSSCAQHLLEQAAAINQQDDQSQHAIVTGQYERQQHRLSSVWT